MIDRNRRVLLVRWALPEAVVLLMTGACATVPIASVSATHGGSSAGYCKMAGTILDALVKTNAEEPAGLERACVEARAMTGHVIFVDARFSRKIDASATPMHDCSWGAYAIRFDPDHFVPAPSAEVVLLLVYDADAGSGVEFNARMERPTWPDRRPGVTALSACGSAFGVLQLQGDKWTAVVTRP